MTHPHLTLEPSLVGVRSDCFIHIGIGKASIALSHDEAYNPMLVITDRPDGTIIGQVSGQVSEAIINEQGHLKVQHAALVIHSLEGLQVLQDALNTARKVLETRSEPRGLFDVAGHMLMAQMVATSTQSVQVEAAMNPEEILPKPHPKKKNISPELAIQTEKTQRVDAPTEPG
jgi:hypothetical protein